MAARAVPPSSRRVSAATRAEAGQLRRRPAIDGTDSIAATEVEGAWPSCVMVAHLDTKLGDASKSRSVAATRRNLDDPASERD